MPLLRRNFNEGVLDLLADEHPPSGRRDVTVHIWEDKYSV